MEKKDFRYILNGLFVEWEGEHLVLHGSVLKVHLYSAKMKTDICAQLISILKFTWYYSAAYM